MFSSEDCQIFHCVYWNKALKRSCYIADKENPYATKHNFFEDIDCFTTPLMHENKYHITQLVLTKSGGHQKIKSEIKL